MALNFPVIKEVIIENFTLYSLKQKIETKINDGVFCLAGANGLGKSTFLSIINYCLTGIVADPEASYKSPDEFYKKCIPYTNKYFIGRVKADSIANANVLLKFDCNDRTYNLKRGFDALNKVFEFSIINQDGEVICEANDTDPEKNELVYKAYLASDIGVATFEQYVFLHYFLLVFDESRKLLFWDRTVLNQIIFLCFGSDPAEAKKSSELMRDIEKEDSLVRNINWQASSLSKEIEELSKGFESFSAEDVSVFEEQYKVVEEEMDILVNEVESGRVKLDGHNANLSELSTRVAQYELRYDELFRESLGELPKSLISVQNNPIIARSLDNKSCYLCKSSTNESIENIKNKISKQVCPLCDSKLERIDEGEIHTKLQQIDDDLVKAKAKLKTILAEIQQQRNINESLIKALELKQSEFDQLTTSNREMMNYLKHKNDNNFINQKIESYNSLRAKAESHRAKRDSLKKENAILQKKIEGIYQKAETSFVESYQILAKAFIGVDLDVKMNFHKGITNMGVTINLSVNGSERNEFSQLSESQRFFLDIALRMSLNQFSSEGNKTTMFIDTPEGSLDITYEKKAGEMFYRHIATGHNIVMTANVNSSEFLKELARKCSRKYMSVVHMTDWCELSAVQEEGKMLFIKALGDIEKELGVSGNA